MDIISKIAKIMETIIGKNKDSNLLGIIVNKKTFLKEAIKESDTQNLFVFYERQHHIAVQPVSSGVRISGIWDPDSSTY